MNITLKIEVKKKTWPVENRPFKHEFQINKFKESPITSPERSLLLSSTSGGHLSVRGKGEQPENKDFVVFRFEKNFDTTLGEHWEETDPTIVICSGALYVLNSDGQKKLPRTFAFKYHSISSDVREERYIERACILNNASEYLQEDALTVIAEGNVEELDGRNWSLIPHWFHSRLIKNFHVEFEKDIKVYLLCFSLHTDCLLKRSTVFRKMWDAPMKEGNETRLPLIKEELPAFLCMLLFMETKKLVLYEATIFHLYKLADKYNIPEVLHECRKHIAEYLPINASAILEFASFFYDTELKRTAESYIELHPRETRERSDNLEVGKESGDDFVCDTRPVYSGLINTKEDFEQHLKSLWIKIVSEIGHEAISSVPLSEMGKDSKPFDFYQ